MASGTGEDSKKLKLYSYWRSSCSCRVRIALKLKGLDYEYIAINLLKDAQKSPEFLKLNPIGYVPVLVDGDFVVADSFAILLYLEEKYPQHPLLPKDLQKRALNYQAANLVSASIQPLQNLPVLGYINEKLGPDEKIPWAQTHIRKGFAALEKLLENSAGRYATGNEVFLADLFLAPQIDTAVKRFNVDMVGPSPKSYHIRNFILLEVMQLKHFQNFHFLEEILISCMLFICFSFKLIKLNGPQVHAALFHVHRVILKQQP